MNVLRFLDPACIALDEDLAAPPAADRETAETAPQAERRKRAHKDALLGRFAGMLDRSGQILNTTKLAKDLREREAQGSTALAPGVAIPHARSKQARRFVIGFVRAAEPVWFDALDGGDTRLFFLLAAPPWDDQVYLRVLRDFAEMMLEEWVAEALAAARDANEVLNVLRGYVAK